MSHMGKGGPWAICSQNIKKMSSCQKDVKCQKMKHLDYGGGSQKNYIDTMRFTDIDINFDVTHDGH